MRRRSGNKPKLLTAADGDGTWDVYREVKIRKRWWWCRYILSGCAVQHQKQGGELLAATRGDGGGGDAGHAVGKMAIGDGATETGLDTGAPPEATTDGRS